MRTDVKYDLDEELRAIIIRVKNLIDNNIKNKEVYLFGSIAKGKYSKNSDIDILILIDDEKNVKELRQIRHYIEEEIDEFNLERDVDIKIYSKERFNDISSNPSFEQAILEDLIDIGGWYNG